MKVLFQPRSMFPILSLVLLFACENNSNSRPVDEIQDSEENIATGQYEISIKGDELDRKTFSGTFTEGGGSYIEEDISESAYDELNLHFKSEHDQGLTLRGNGAFLLTNNSRDVVSLGDPVADRNSLSHLIIIVETEGSNLILSSTNGTATVSNVDIGEWRGGTVYANYDLEINGTFRSPGKDERYEVSGSFEVNSIKN